MPLGVARLARVDQRSQRGVAGQIQRRGALRLSANRGGRTGEGRGGGGLVVGLRWVGGVKWGVR